MSLEYLLQYNGVSSSLSLLKIYSSQIIDLCEISPVSSAAKGNAASSNFSAF